MTRWRVFQGMMMVMLMMSFSNMASAYTAEVSCFFDGIRLETGDTAHDPTVLVMIFGEPDEIERVLMPEGDVTQFPNAPMIDLSAIFQPVWETPLWFLAERALQIAVVNETETFALDHLLFESVEAGYRIAIRPGDYLVAQTGIGTFFKITAAYLGDLDVRLTVDAVPEPTSILLFGIGIVFIAGWLRPWRKKKTITLGLLSVVLSMSVIGHPLLVNAQDAPVVTIYKEGTGDGTIIIGDQHCDSGCEDISIPYSERTAAVVKVLPNADSTFIGWKKMDSATISGKIHLLPGESVSAVLEKMPDAPPLRAATHQFFVMIHPTADQQELQRLKQQVGFLLAEPFDWIQAELWYTSLTADAAIEQLKHSPAFTYVGPDSIFTSGSTIPNDPQMWRNWGHYQIHLPEVWDTITGSEVVTAVLDTGIDYTHDELRENMWRNPGEIPNNTKDDDNNGCVDDVYGCNFVTKSIPRGNVMDDHGHGTHCAGIIAARGNNGIGAVGVNWTGKLMAVKVTDKNGNVLVSRVANGIKYAVDMGAKITNNSYAGAKMNDVILYHAIQYAQQHDQLFVTIAHNQGVNIDVQPWYPASYPLENILAVAATEKSDNLWASSNYGATSVDLGAPGVDHYSTMPGNRYESFNGTSTAAPFVTGVAGLLKAACPGLSALEIKQRIMETVDPFPSLQGKTVTGGRLNALRALQSCIQIAPMPTPQPTPRPTPTPGPNPTPHPTPTPTPPPHTTCGTDDAEAGWYFVYSVRIAGSCGGLIGTNWQWFGPDTAKAEVEFRNGIRPAKAWCVPGHASLSVVPEHGHWYYTCTLSPAGNDQVYVQWRW